MAAHFAHHLLTAIPQPILPFIRNEFALNYTQSGFVVSAFGLAYGGGQLPAGWLADRIGPRILITIGIAGVAVAGFLVGLSHTYIMVLVFLVMMGVLAGGYHPSSAPLISASVELRKRGQAFGFHAVGGNFSFFLAPIIVAGVATAWGWRGSFISLAIPVAIFGIVFYIILGRRAGEVKRQPVVSEQHDETMSEPGSMRPLVVFMILSLSTGAVATSIRAFIALYMVDHFGETEATAAVFLSILAIGGLWAGPVGGYISDRLGRVPVVLTACFLSGPIIYLLNLVPQGMGVGALLLLFGITEAVRMPVSEAYIISRAPERRRSMIFGIYYFGMMESGAAFVPVMGFLIDHFGFYTSFSIASTAVFAVALICSVFLWGNRN